MKETQNQLLGYLAFMLGSRDRKILPTCMMLKQQINVQAKGKVKFFLHTPWRQIRGVEVWPHLSLTSALGEGEWSPSCPGCFTIRKRAPITTE
jgi:hypothetical protein